MDAIISWVYQRKNLLYYIRLAMTWQITDPLNTHMPFICCWLISFVFVNQNPDLIPKFCAPLLPEFLQDKLQFYQHVCGLNPRFVFFLLVEIKRNQKFPPVKIPCFSYFCIDIYIFTYNHIYIHIYIHMYI